MESVPIVSSVSKIGGTAEVRRFSQWSEENDQMERREGENGDGRRDPGSCKQQAGESELWGAEKSQKIRYGEAKLEAERCWKSIMVRQARWKWGCRIGR